jgi:hypothetical protein
MILSASRRTDLPRCYAEWFMRRLRAGYVLTRNPRNPSQLSRIPLSPDIVDCIVFWTKDASNMLPCLDELDWRGYSYYFQFTLTPYGAELEPGLRDKRAIAENFISLSKRLGKTRVVWRYDPIVLNDSLNIPYHKSRFSRMCERLAPYTDTVTISFVDLYPKIKTPLVRQISDGEIAELAGFIGQTAKEYGLRAVACCEGGLEKYGISPSCCIDRQRIEQICGCSLKLPADKNRRKGCGCFESVDIGVYNTCPAGCVYCYANDSPASARRRYVLHDPRGELLSGGLFSGEKITEKSVKSNKTAQFALPKG